MPALPGPCPAQPASSDQILAGARPMHVRGRSPGGWAWFRATNWR